MFAVQKANRGCGQVKGSKLLELGFQHCWQLSHSRRGPGSFVTMLGELRKILQPLDADSWRFGEPAHMKSEHSIQIAGGILKSKLSVLPGSRELVGFDSNFQVLMFRRWGS